MSEFGADRLAWIDAAIVATIDWINEAEAEARLELQFSSPGEFDHDYSTDRLALTANANETLAQLNGERAQLMSVRARRRGGADSD